MKILNSEHRTWYLKAININDKSNTLWLSFRQDALYSIDSNPYRNKDYYKNVLLVLYFDDYLTAEEHFNTLKQLLLYQVVSVDEDSPNVIEFVGSYDVNVGVVKYEEIAIDQSAQDWEDRYLWASKMYSELYRKQALESNFVKEVEILLTSYEKNNPDYGNNSLYQAISGKLKALEFPKINSAIIDPLPEINE